MSTNLNDFKIGQILMLYQNGKADYPFMNTGVIPNKEYYEKCKLLDKLSFKEADNDGELVYYYDQVLTKTKKARGILMRRIWEKDKMLKKSKQSELLEQRDMLLKSLRECVRLLDEENEPVYHGFDEEVNRAKEAIQKCQ